MLSALFELLNFGLGLPVDKTKETAIMLVANAVAFILAFKATGWLYDRRIIRSRLAGVITHWTIRSIILVINWAYSYALIWAGRQAYQHLIASVCIAAVAVVSVVIYKLVKRKKGGAASA